MMKANRKRQALWKKFAIQKLMFLLAKAFVLAKITVTSPNSPGRPLLTPLNAEVLVMFTCTSPVKLVGR